MAVNVISLFTYVFRKDAAVRAGTGLVALVLAITAWVLFANSGKDSSYTHMHCPVCQEEVIYSARMAGSECPLCANGAVYVPTVGSVREGTIGPSTGGKIFLFLVVALVLVQGLTYLAFQRSKVVRKAEEEARNKLVVCRCPYCRRKVGFRAAQAGTGGVCPRCKTAFIFQESEPTNTMDSHSVSEN